MRVHAFEENASYEGTADVARGASNKDVRDVADVLLHIQSQVLKCGAEDGDTHPLQEQETGTRCNQRGKLLRVSTFLHVYSNIHPWKI